MADVRNKPSPEGRKVGAQLARLTDKAFEQFKDADPPFQEPCTTCAFQGGSFPNGCAETVMDAIKCVMERHPFYCHESKDCKDLCAGWYVAQAAIGMSNQPVIPTPWPFSQEGCNSPTSLSEPQ